MANRLIANYGETIVRKTTTPGQTDPDTGVWLPGTETIESFEAVIRPLADRDLLTQVKAEGLETNRGIQIYSETALFGSDEKTAQGPDIITWRGNDYVVYSVWHNYQITSLAHYKSIAFLQNS